MQNYLYPLAVLRPFITLQMGAFSFEQRWNNIFGTPYNLDYAVVVTKEDKEKHEQIFKNWQIIKKPWDIFLNNSVAIENDISWKIINENNKFILPQNNNYIQPNNIYIEDSVELNFCNLNASEGPIYISQNSKIMQGTSLKGPIYIGENSIIKMNTCIYGGTSIFDNCVVGGEIKNSIIMNYSNKAHEGYMGDSVIGQLCNWGAGTYNSNVKNSFGKISMYDGETKNNIEVGSKCGVIMGDFSCTSIGTLLNSGTIIGPVTNIFNHNFLDNHIKPFTWGNKKYLLENALQNIRNWELQKKITEPIFLKDLITDYYNSI